MTRRSARWIAPACALLVLGCSLATSYEDFSGVIPRRPPPAKRGVTGAGGPRRGAASTVFRFLDSETEPLGYDIDNWCTTCERGIPSCQNGATVACDNYRICIDNQVQQLVSGLQKQRVAGDPVALEAMAASLASGLATGKHGVYVEIEGWDGQIDDDEITFSIMNVTGVVDDEVVPQRKNQYHVDPASLLPGEIPKATVRGYVADNKVVARGFSFDMILQLQVTSPEAPGRLFDVTVRAPFRNALFVGTLTGQSEDSFSMVDAEITGGLPAELVQRELFQLGFCPDNPEEAGLFQQVCKLRDLSAVDPANLDAACDSMSFAVGMNLQSANRIGTARPADNDVREEKQVSCPLVAPGCR